ncbi:hypothetical protein PoB_007519400 [Plakobranchus ocellatus]|uniref:Uncharacterized protein n=1 Tax=Plakobranchus ocellatus TaxID=259542 RepID=A0AAV4DX98_9GAST|nr:hypothetical protein PoB_007519400 [Plakobranchus ocellatus]
MSGKLGLKFHKFVPMSKAASDSGDNDPDSTAAAGGCHTSEVEDVRGDTAVVDAFLMFIITDVGEYSKNSDGAALKTSGFGKAFINEELDLLNPSILPGTNEEILFISLLSKRILYLHT